MRMDYLRVAGLLGPRYLENVPSSASTVTSAEQSSLDMRYRASSGKRSELKCAEQTVRLGQKSSECQKIEKQTPLEGYVKIALASHQPDSSSVSSAWIQTTSEHSLSLLKPRGHM